MITAITIWFIGYMFSLGAKGAHDDGLCAIDFIMALFIWPAFMGFMWRSFK